MKPHTIREQLVKPVAIDNGQNNMRRRRGLEIASVSLSNNTVKRRIADLSLNTKDQVVAWMKKAGKWSYRLDELTDTGKNAQLMV